MVTGRFYLREKNELPEPITLRRGITWLLMIFMAITVGLILARIS